MAWWRPPLAPRPSLLSKLLVLMLRLTTCCEHLKTLALKVEERRKLLLRVPLTLLPYRQSPLLLIALDGNCRPLLALLARSLEFP